MDGRLHPDDEEARGLIGGGGGGGHSHAAPSSGDHGGGGHGGHGGHFDFGEVRVFFCYVWRLGWLLEQRGVWEKDGERAAKRARARRTGARTPGPVLMHALIATPPSPTTPQTAATAHPLETNNNQIQSHPIQSNPITHHPRSWCTR